MYFEEGGDWVIVLYKPCGMVFLTKKRFCPVGVYQC